MSDLKIRTKDSALAIIRMVDRIPRPSVGCILGRQIVRSGTSVGANYREAYRARSRAEFIAKCGDSLREIEETGYWLELLSESGLVAPSTLAALVKECGELTAIYVVILKRTQATSAGAS